MYSFTNKIWQSERVKVKHSKAIKYEINPRPLHHLLHGVSANFMLKYHILHQLGYPECKTYSRQDRTQGWAKANVDGSIQHDLISSRYRYIGASMTTDLYLEHTEHETGATEMATRTDGLLQGKNLLSIFSRIQEQNSKAKKHTS